MPRRTAPLLLLLAALLGASVLSGCATRDEAAPPQVGTGFPLEVTPPGGKPLKFDREPQRIVSLSPTATETLFAVGAGRQVVAVDSLSNFPEGAPHSKLSALTPDPAAIGGYAPDLVIVSADAGGKLTAALDKLGAKTLVLSDAKTLDDAFAQFSLLGKVTGHPAEGEDLAKRTRADIDKIVADTPKPTAPLTYYHELDQTFYSLTSATFIGGVYSRFGLVNIADAGDPHAAGGYPQLSAERILKADPKLIFLGDTKCCGQNAQSVGARPGWNTLSAVKSGNVVALDDDIASRWGPRVTDLVRAVAAAVAKAGK
ncbi:ABC transporter substrate-binding protein [Amycolatopsis sp. CA-230715]|uniref:ABC transporter substrate-binding protein n=1 Tax=Amycolatopsis sp. CA-230715 TaxID=2745196 RepID=UPI001C00996A|nr:ABC transporter substrate-binding protein [Amycolatopsis sp. CA-230715]QWF83184.1 Vitamin B12-binding protein [Amycolatopsis sp. CA-230715]